LERQDGKTMFTGFQVKATLQVDKGTDLAKAERLLHKAEAACLITNSLIAESELDATVVTK
jgi:organic hydroperoxide reductase OsmC/OhrA